MYLNYLLTSKRFTSLAKFSNSTNTYAQTNIQSSKIKIRIVIRIPIAIAKSSNFPTLSYYFYIDCYTDDVTTWVWTLFNKHETRGL